MEDLVETEPLAEIAYARDFKVTLIRNVSNIIMLSSDELHFSAQLQLANNVERDVATLLIRGFHQKFQENPNLVKTLSEKDFYKKKEEIWMQQLSRLQKDLMEAKSQLSELKSVSAEMEEAQKTIEDLQMSLKEYRETTRASDTELDQLKQDVNFYRQESAIYEGKNSKLA